MKNRSYAVADIETDPFAHGRHPRPFCAGFFDGKAYTSFWGKDCIAKLADVIRLYDGDVYFHNGGKFDVHYLLEHISLDKPVTFLKINGRIAKLPFGKATILDSFLLLPIALRRLEKIDIDYDKMESGVRETHKAEILHYLRGDCISLRKHLTRFFDEHGRGLTLASRAFATLKTTVPKMKKTGLVYDGRFRPYYFGGRVQCFDAGVFEDGPYYHYDINSAYPYAMTHEHWFGGEFVAMNCAPIQRLEQSLLTVECTSSGALPKRGKDGSVNFPVETGVFNCTGWEYVAGVETGRITGARIVRAFVPKKVQSFSSYVHRFWARKEDATTCGDKAGREFAKLMLNSAYGKFALNPRKFTDSVLCRLGEYPGDGFGDPVSVSLERGVAEFAKPSELEALPCHDVATAASITGFVRAMVLRAVSTQFRPFYCDTDSLICDMELPDFLIGDSLGAWKLEATYRFLAIAGKKIYAGRTKEGAWKTACKGARVKPEQIVKVARGETVHWKSDAPSFTINDKKKLFIERTIRKTV